MLSVVRAVGTGVERACLFLALAGGVVVAGMALVTTASVIGRALLWAGLGPIRGDFELVEMGAAVSAFWFLPYVHLTRGHVAVDLLTARLSGVLQRAAIRAGDAAILAIATVVAWRLVLGLGEKLRYGESTMILGAPVWIGYAGCVLGAAAFVAAAIVVLLRGPSEAAA